jgi:hypothetical protein
MQTMMLSSSKAVHVGQILSTAMFGQVLTQSLTPPQPSTVEAYGHLVVQVLVALVTIWAAVRKALQKPETVTQVPTEVVPTAGPVLPTPTPSPDGSAK